MHPLTQAHASVSSPACARGDSPLAPADFMQKTLLLSTLLLPLTLSAADRAADYETVKRIALRDPKVRAAYAAADRKLAERIVTIDPTLAGYTPGQPAAKTSPAKARPAAASAPNASIKDREVFHVVASGETLGSIAANYRVTSGALQRANKISDPRKLAVGQKLIVPGGKKPAAKPATQPAKAKPATKAEEKSWWDRVTGS
jgi:LysM repeat protein